MELEMSIGSIQSASSQKMDFMNLLVTQLQNQNPLEPMNNQDMSAQLAQFSQLEQLENLNQSFDQVLQNTQRSFANDMIGKRVSFIDMGATNPDGSPGVVRSGQVLKMDMYGDQEMLRVAEVDPLTLQIREYDIEADEVTSIIDPFENS
ncbi:MAG: flagellar hook capping protein [Phycisphaerae bacterium]|nr:flagellar hook capping protein [Phycisphaerae bacterium]